MITRGHVKGDAPSTALYSECERYRYALTRCWDPEGRRLLYIMLNPSKATEAQNDPTIERCERRARTLGYGAFRACNIFAWRDTDPRALRLADDPCGPDNNAVLKDAADWADTILCAWGVHAAHHNRGPEVEAFLRRTGQPLYHLGLTKGGHPRHPLYISYSTMPEGWPPAG